MAIPDKASIHITIRNTGEHPITAFSMGFSHLNAAGERVPCGGRGVDMIDWSDPMPRRNIYITDLEQRTTGLTKGAGHADTIPH